MGKFDEGKGESSVICQTIQILLIIITFWLNVSIHQTIPLANHSHCTVLMHACSRMYTHTHMLMHAHMHKHTQMYAHTHTHTHRCTHTGTHPHVHAHTHVCTHTYAHTRTRTHTHTHTHTHSFVLPEMIRELNNMHIMLTVVKGYIFVCFLTVPVSHWPFSDQVHHFG